MRSSLRWGKIIIMRALEERIKTASTADAEELWKIIRDPHPEVISTAILNRNLTEDMAVFIAKKKGTPQEALGFLANDIRFKESYKLKLAVCRNPKTPQRTTLSLLKFLRVFDLCDIVKDQLININIRQKIEYIISERIPSMPSGVKLALAKRANANIVMSLLESSDERVVGACLDSPVLTEGHFYKLINRPATKAVVIKMLAEHAKWSLRYFVRFALIRSFYTPMCNVVKFIDGMKTADLKDLYSDPKLPASTRPFIFRELLNRGETAEVQEDEVHVLAGDEDTLFPDTGDIETEVD